MTARISRRDLIAGAAAGFLTAARLRGQASDPTTLTIVDAARLVASRQLSPLELTRAYLARIEQQNGRLNVYITVTADAALAQARALEAEIYAYHAKYVADQERRKLYQSRTLQQILDGAAISLPSYIEGYRRMIVARNTISAVFANVDLLVTPTTRVMPGKVAEPPTGLIRNTVPFNALGIPTSACRAASRAMDSRSDCR